MSLKQGEIPPRLYRQPVRSKVSVTLLHAPTLGMSPLLAVLGVWWGLTRWAREDGGHQVRATGLRYWDPPRKDLRLESSCSFGEESCALEGGCGSLC